VRAHAKMGGVFGNHFRKKFISGLWEPLGFSQDEGPGKRACFSLAMVRYSWETTRTNVSRLKRNDWGRHGEQFWKCDINKRTDISNVGGGGFCWCVGGVSPELSQPSYGGRGSVDPKDGNGWRTVESDPCGGVLSSGWGSLANKRMRG